MTDYTKPTKDGSEKGKFVGDPSKTHIHIVKANTHIIVIGKRKNFDENDKKGLQKALDHLDEYGTSGTPGYDNCKAWLEAEISDF